MPDDVDDGDQLEFESVASKVVAVVGSRHPRRRVRACSKAGCPQGQ
jgi:hypothetical protein